jgi:biopolymer transport protein ExbB
MIFGLILQVTQTATDTMANAAQALNKPAEQSISLWDLANKGGPILIPIGILSVMAVYIFFERYFTIQRFSKWDVNFMNMIRDHVHNGNIDAAKSLCKHTKGPVARMIEKGLMRLGKPIHEIEGAIENVGKLEVYTMEKNLGIMSTIAGLAPMFGFLGTIFGELYQADCM